MHGKASILIVDDDPSHLKIYGLIVEGAGYRALLAQVRYAGVELPENLDDPADLVLMDYHLAGRTSAVEVVQSIQARMPNVPVLVLSDALALPDDIAPFVQGFVRKGNPARLVDTLHALLRPSPMTTIT